MVRIVGDGTIEQKASSMEGRTLLLSPQELAVKIKDENGMSTLLTLHKCSRMYVSRRTTAAKTRNVTCAALAGSSTKQPRSMIPSLFGRDVGESKIKRPVSSVLLLNKGMVNGNGD